MRYDVLGPLGLVGPAGDALRLGKRSAAALCWLVMNANRDVGWESLAAVVWPQGGAVGRVRILLRTVAVSLPSGALELGTRARLVVPDGAVDAGRFERLVIDAQDHLHGGDVARATANLHAALDLWRGDPYPELDRGPQAMGEVDRLIELRLTAIEELNAVRLRGPVDYTVVADLREFAALHPERARTRQHLAVALYLANRQIDALEVLRGARRDLGDPDGRIARLQTAILSRDPQLATGAVLDG